jgi:hypothetical protein
MRFGGGTETAPEMAAQDAGVDLQRLAVVLDELGVMGREIMPADAAAGQRGDHHLGLQHPHLEGGPFRRRQAARRTDRDRGAEGGGERQGERRSWRTRHGHDALIDKPPPDRQPCARSGEQGRQERFRWTGGARTTRTTRCPAREMSR